MGFISKACLFICLAVVFGGGRLHVDALKCDVCLFENDKPVGDKCKEINCASEADVKASGDAFEKAHKAKAGGGGRAKPEAVQPAGGEAGGAAAPEPAGGAEGAAAEAGGEGIGAATEAVAEGEATEAPAEEASERRRRGAAHARVARAAKKFQCIKLDGTFNPPGDKEMKATFLGCASVDDSQKAKKDAYQVTAMTNIAGAPFKSGKLFVCDADKAACKPPDGGGVAAGGATGQPPTTVAVGFLTTLLAGAASFFCSA